MEVNQRVRLHDLLIRRFDENELRTLCFYLDVDYESLAGKGKVGKARDLLAYLERHDRIRDLLEIGHTVRPDISWYKGREVTLAATYALRDRSAKQELVRLRTSAFLISEGKKFSIPDGVTLRNLREKLGIHGVTEADDAFLKQFPYGGEIPSSLPRLLRTERRKLWLVAGNRKRVVRGKQVVKALGGGEPILSETSENLTKFEEGAPIPESVGQEYLEGVYRLIQVEDEEEIYLARGQVIRWIPHPAALEILIGRLGVFQVVEVDVAFRRQHIEGLGVYHPFSIDPNPEDLTET